MWYGEKQWHKQSSINKIQVANLAGRDKIAFPNKVYFLLHFLPTNTHTSAPTSSYNRMQLRKTEGNNKWYTILTLLIWCIMTQHWWDRAREQKDALLLPSSAELSMVWTLCQATQDRNGPDWTEILMSCRFFVCMQQILRLLETNFVPVQHKRDFLSVSTILCFYWAWNTDSGILLSVMLPHRVHLYSCQCKCTYRVMRRCVLENETALSIEKEKLQDSGNPAVWAEERNISKGSGRQWREWLRNLRDFVSVYLSKPSLWWEIKHYLKWYILKYW